MRLSFPLAIVFSLGLLLAPAFAQTQDAEATSGASTDVQLPDPLTEESARALVSTLSDEQARALLLERLDLEAKEQQTDTDSDEQVLGLLTRSIVGLGESALMAVQNMPALFGGVRTGVNNFLDGRGSAGALNFVGLLLVAILAGAAVEWLVNRAQSGWRTRIRDARPSTLTETLRLLSSRFFLDLVGVIVFALVTTFVIGQVMSAPMDRFVATLLVLWLIVMIRVVSAVLRFVLAPADPELRLVTADDETARFLHRNLLIVAAFIGLEGFAVPALARNGIPLHELHLGFWLNLGAYAWIILTIWRARVGIAKILIGEHSYVTPGTRRLAAWWPPIAIAIVFLDWVLTEILARAGQFDLLRGRTVVPMLILAAPVFDLMIRNIVKHLIRPIQGQGAVVEEAYRQIRRSYVRIGRVILIVIGISIVSYLWGISPLHLATESLGEQIADRSVGGLFILAAGYLAWEVVNIWAYRNLANQTADDEHVSSGDEGGGGNVASRLDTVLPLVRLALQTAIVVTAALLALSQLGMNITTLLAGAGIVGIAIGFGAQTLVRDVVSGIFFLLDDAFRVGEYVDIGGTVGTVDKIAVRSLRLRHPRGALHVIPYGEISKLTNMSRDWVLVKLNFTVAYDTDVNQVKKLFKQIGRDLMEVPEFAETLLEPFKFQGVYGYDDVGIIVRGKFMAKPGKQFAARKQIMALVRKGFEENGIEFARKEVRVHVPSTDRELTDEQKQAAAAAAGQAAADAQRS